MNNRDTSLGKKDIAQVILFLAALILFFILMGKAREVREMYWLEQAEHEVDTMLVMEGVYEENGLILTEDGHEWIWLHDEPKAAGTKIQVIFQTNNLPEQKWEMLAVMEVQ